MSGQNSNHIIKVAELPVIKAHSDKRIQSFFGDAGDKFIGEVVADNSFLRDVPMPVMAVGDNNSISIAMFYSLGAEAIGHVAVSNYHGLHSAYREFRKIAPRIQAAVQRLQQNLAELDHQDIQANDVARITRDSFHRQLQTAAAFENWKMPAAYIHEMLYRGDAVEHEPVFAGSVIIAGKSVRKTDLDDVIDNLAGHKIPINGVLNLSPKGPTRLLEPQQVGVDVHIMENQWRCARVGLQEKLGGNQYAVIADPFQNAAYAFTNDASVRIRLAK